MQTEGNLFIYIIVNACISYTIMILQLQLRLIMQQRINKIIKIDS